MTDTEKNELLEVTVKHHFVSAASRDEDVRRIRESMPREAWDALLHLNPPKFHEERYRIPFEDRTVPALDMDQFLFLAMKEGSQIPIGQAICGVYPPSKIQKDCYGGIFRLYVSPEYRDHKIGKALISKMVDVAREETRLHMNSLRVYVPDPPAEIVSHRIYRRLRFTRNEHGIYVRELY